MSSDTLSRPERSADALGRMGRLSALGGTVRDGLPSWARLRGPAGPRRPRQPLPGSTALVVWFLAVVSGLAVWVVAYPVAIGALQEQNSQQKLFALLRMELSQATAPVGPAPYGDPVALMDSPVAGLRGVVVVEGTAGQDLERGPGHRRDTVLPGQAGTAVVLARSVTFGAPFGHVRGLHARDAVTVTTGQGVFTYVVERVRRPGDPLPRLLRTGESRLILGTAEGTGWRSGFAPTSVVYVDALLKGAAQPSPGGLPRMVPKVEQPMGSSTQPLLALVLWLQGLVFIVVAAVWLRARWGRWQAYSVSLPVVLAVGIGASGTAAQLLPNLL